MTQNNLLVGWGSNAYGKLTFKREDIIDSPKKINVVNAHEEVYSVVCGRDHTVFWTKKGIFISGDMGSDKADETTFWSVQDAKEEFIRRESQMSKKTFHFKGPFLEKKNILSVAAGEGTTFCLTSEALYGWGMNFSGRIDPDKGERIVKPVILCNSPCDLENYSFGTFSTRTMLKEKVTLLCLQRSVDKDSLFGSEYLPFDLFCLILARSGLEIDLFKYTE